MSIFEAIMLICFGISWPFSIAKTLRTRQVAGKSPIFMAIIAVGYVSGIIHRTLNYDRVLILYIVNLVMVTTDLALYYRYLPKAGAAR